MSAEMGIYSLIHLQHCPYQHGCSEVKLVEELRDEDVHLEHVGHVLPLDVSQDVDEPLEVSVRSQRY